MVTEQTIQTVAEHLRGLWIEHKAEYTYEDYNRLDLDKCEEEFYVDQLLGMGYSDEDIDTMLDYLAYN